MRSAMVGLDTSVVLRLLVGEPEEQAQAAQTFLDELFEAGEKAAVSDLVGSEVYFALQFHYKVPTSEALAPLKAMFQSGEVASLGRADRILETRGLASAKPGFVDRLIHAEYEANTDAMATFEKKAARLASTRILNC